MRDSCLKIVWVQGHKCPYTEKIHPSLDPTEMPISNSQSNILEKSAYSFEFCYEQVIGCISAVTDWGAAITRAFGHSARLTMPGLNRKEGLSANFVVRAFRLRLDIHNILGSRDGRTTSFPKTGREPKEGNSIGQYRQLPPRAPDEDEPLRKIDQDRSKQRKIAENNGKQGKTTQNNAGLWSRDCRRTSRCTDGTYIAGYAPAPDLHTRVGSAWTSIAKGLKSNDLHTGPSLSRRPTVS